MPAAAAKVERINDQAGDLNNNKMKMTANQQNPSQDPTKIANTIIEKKIRNLEKRKVFFLNKIVIIIRICNCILGSSFGN